MERSPTTPRAYAHDFDGKCIPKDEDTRWATFSVGIFQWLPKSGGRGLKKSAAKYRIRGSVGNADAVFARAREICRLLDAGEPLRTKSEMVPNPVVGASIRPR